MSDGSPEKVILTRFDKTPDSLLKHLHEMHGPNEVAALTPKADVAGLSPATQAYIASVYALNPQQLLEHISGLGARLAKHVAGAGYTTGSEVSNLIAPAGNDVASKFVSAHLTDHPEIRQLLT
jgi:hypothetical protein